MEKQNEKSLIYAWYVVIVLMLANISSFIDRQILYLLVDSIKRDLHLSDTEMSLLMGFSFALFYTIFGVFIGHLLDKFNRRNIVIAGVTVWSLMTALCGGINTYTQFFFVRMGVGVGESTLSPSAYSIISDYFPKNKLATALSTYSMGVFLGMGLASVIGASIIGTLPKSGLFYVPIFGAIYPWQMVFIYIGLPGLLIALLMLTIREPKRKDVGFGTSEVGDFSKSDVKNPKYTEGSSDFGNVVSDVGNFPTSDIPNPTLNEALKIIWLQRKAYLPISIGTAFTAFVSYGAAAWIPTYFNRTFGWQMKVVGFKYGLVVTIFSGLGVLIGGYLADYYAKNGVKDGKLRVGLISGIGILASSFNFLLSDPDMILKSLAIPAFFIAFPLGASAAAVQELMPNRVRALASSIFLFFINIIGMGLGPLVVALFTDFVYHDEKMIKYSLIGLYLIGGVATIICFLIGIKQYKNVKFD
jgi:MFS family permease